MDFENKDSRIALFLASNPFDGSPSGGAESSMLLLWKTLQRKNLQATLISRGKPPTKATGIKSFRLLPWTRSSLFNRILFPVVSLQVGLILLAGRFDILYFFYEPYAVRILRHPFAKISGCKFVLRWAGMGWRERSASDLRDFLGLARECHGHNIISAGLQKEICADFLKRKIEPFFTQDNTLIGDIGTEIPANVASKRGNAEGPFQLICVGRFTAYQKRQDILLQALATMPLDRQRDFRITFVGSGPTLSKIKGLVEDLGLSGVTAFHPFTSKDKLSDLLAGADLLCQPTDNEGLGKIVIEALASGLPALVSNVPPYDTDFVGSGVFKVENSPASWALALNQLEGNIELLGNASAAGAKWIRENYSADKNVLRFLRFFSQVSNRMS